MKKQINLEVLPTNNDKGTQTGFKNSASIEPFHFMGSTSGSPDFWSFGSDNLFPYSLALLGRGVPIHRRILNDKRDYTTGKGFICDDKNKDLIKFIEKVNKDGENLSSLVAKPIFDYWQGGNSYIEVVTNRKQSFLSFFHQDYTKCRLNKEKTHIILNSDWCSYNKSESKFIPIYPVFEELDGYMRSIIVYKDYEPMYTNYGVPNYISGLNVSAIAYKTDRWNISRLDNSFQLSGVMEIDADEEDELKIERIKKTLEKKFKGNPGEVFFLLKNKVEEGRGTKFTPIASSNEGDWGTLHDSSNNDIIVAHSWFKELSGFDYTTGFSPERILYAYEIALNTVIRPTQNKIITPLRECIENILNIDASTLDFVNKPPITVKPSYMKVWEARKADGMDFDENDPLQNIYLAELNKSKNGTSDNSK